jgi:hypothetical protein
MYIIDATTQCTSADDLTAVSNDCTKFNRCSNGILYTFSCPAGTIFDNAQKVCVYGSSTNCQSTTSTKKYKNIHTKILLFINYLFKSSLYSISRFDCCFRQLYNVLYMFEWSFRLIGFKIKLKKFVNYFQLIF